MVESTSASWSGLNAIELDVQKLTVSFTGFNLCDKPSGQPDFDKGQILFDILAELHAAKNDRNLANVADEDPEETVMIVLDGGTLKLSEFTDHIQRISNQVTIDDALGMTSNENGKSVPEEL